jgi:hypothetical protein
LITKPTATTALLLLLLLPALPLLLPLLLLTALPLLLPLLLLLLPALLHESISQGTRLLMPMVARAPSECAASAALCVAVCAL